MEISFLFFENKANDFFDEKETQTHFFSEFFLGERSEVFLCFSSVGEKMEKKKNSKTNSHDNALFDRLVANSYWEVLLFSCFIKTYCSEDRA